MISMGERGADTQNHRQDGEAKQILVDDPLSVGTQNKHFEAVEDIVQVHIDWCTG